MSPKYTNLFLFYPPPGKWSKTFCWNVSKMKSSHNPKKQNPICWLLNHFPHCVSSPLELQSSGSQWGHMDQTETHFQVKFFLVFENVLQNPTPFSISSLQTLWDLFSCMVLFNWMWAFWTNLSKIKNWERINGPDASWFFSHFHYSILVSSFLSLYCVLSSLDSKVLGLYYKILGNVCGSI